MMEVDKEEAIAMLEDGMEIMIKVGNHEFKVGDMHNYIGAPEDKSGYISEYLGNVWYEDAENVIDETIKGMADGDKQLIDNALIYTD